MDRRKMGVLLLLVAAVLAVAALFWWLNELNMKKSEGVKENVLIETPDGIGKGIDKSKLEAYGGRKGGSSAISDYWDDIAEPEDIISGEVQKSGDTAEDMYQRGKARAEEYQREQDERLKKETQARAEAAARIRDDSRERVVETTKELTQLQIDMMKEQGIIEGEGQPADSAQVTVQEEPEPEPERIDIERARVSRSSSVSSLDGGGGLGSSTDDDFVSEDEFYPFMCQFVREEKIKGGERITIRLLEDMVVDGVLVPRNTHLMASCSISRRLELKVTSVEIAGRMYNLGYDAYDNDGSKGIYCPAIEENVKRGVERVGSSSARRASSRWGRAAQDVVDLGLTVTRSSGGRQTVTVPRGYVFYLVKSKTQRKSDVNRG